MTFQRSRGLGHLHQGNHSLLHSGSAGTGENNHRQVFFGGAFHCPGNLFPHHIAHAAHQKPSVADTHHSLFSVNGAFTAGDSLVNPVTLFQGSCFLLIFRIFQGIFIFDSFVPFLVSAFIRHHTQTFLGADAEIFSAFITNIMILPYILFVEKFSAALAFDP